MFAIEFNTIIEDGIIKIPVEYQKRFTKGVRVILLSEELENEALPEGGTYIDRLLANPIQVKDFRPLTRDEIYER